MSRIFLSHASQDAFEAAALRNWLAREGWDDVFLDFDPDRGIAAGERWEQALHAAATRCEAVIFLVSEAWLASGWCRKEYELARSLNKKLFALLVSRELTLSTLPAELVHTWQVVDLARGQDMETLDSRPPGIETARNVSFSAEGLRRLRRGLEKAGLDPGFFAWPPADEPGRAPYRGLKPLEAEDAGVFFGRDAPIVEAIDRLRGLIEGAAPRLFVLLGASGAGKSSFLRAGLLPRLSRDDTAFLPLPPLRPERAALTGENGLLGALIRAFPSRGRDELLAAVERGAEGLRPLLAELVAAAVARRVASDEKPPTIVLPIDQAEELLAADSGPEGFRLLEILRDLASCDEPAVIVVFVIRSDSYDALERAKPLEGLRQSTMPLLPMPRSAFKEVIEGPARRLAERGGRFALDAQLVERLVAEIEQGGGSDALPLLAFTLEQLFLEQGGTGTVGLPAYEAFGGLKGAIGAAVARCLARADADSRIPSDPATRALLLRRGLIPWLAGIDPDTRTPRRHVARRDEIPAESLPLIDLLVEERLLSADTVDEGTGPGGGTRRVATIEPAHEALLRQWDLLSGWLEEDFLLLVTLDGVARAARDWLANGRSTPWLAHRGPRLAEAETLRARPDLDAKLGESGRAYLAACRSREERVAAEAEQLRLEREHEQERRLADAEALAASERRTAQRTRIGLATAVALAVAAAAFGFYAQTQRSAAQLALTTATNTANTLIFDLAQRFRGVTGMPASLVKAIFDKTLSLQSTLIGAGQTSPDLLRSQASALSAASSILVTVGDTGAARDAASRSIDIWRGLLRDRPDDDGAKANLATAFDNLGYALLLGGDAAGAHAAYEQSLDIARALDRRNPTPPRRRALARSLQNVGDTKGVGGDDRGAVASYDEALAILRPLRRGEDSRDVSDEIAHLLDRQGEVKDRMGDRDGAAAALDESLSLRRELAEDKTDAVAQRNLAWTLGKIGEFRERSGDRRGALEAYDESLRIRRLLAADGSNARAQRDLASSLTKIVDIRRQLGDLDGAGAAAREAVEIARGFARDKSNSEAQRNLALTLQSAGDVALASDDEAGASKAYEEALGLFRTLASVHASPTALRDLALMLDSIADLKTATGDRTGAREALEESLALRRKRAASAPSDEAMRDLGIGIDKLGDAKLADGEGQGALALYEEGLAISRKLARDGAHGAQSRRDLMLSVRHVGEAKAELSDPKGALAAFEEALAILRELAAQPAQLPTTQRDLASILDRIGAIKERLADPAGAAAAFRESVDILRGLSRDDPRARQEAGTVAGKLAALQMRLGEYKDAAVSYDIAAEPLRAALAAGQEAVRSRLAALLNQLGGARLQFGDNSGAAAAFEEGIAVARPLARDDFGRKNLAGLLNNLGLAREKAKDQAGALTAYREVLGLREDLARRDPAPQTQLDLAVTLEKLGDLEIGLKQLDEGRADLGRAIAIRQKLVASVRGADHLKEGIVNDAERIGVASYEYLLRREFTKALDAAEYAISLAPDLLWMQTNKAHALMFLGRTDEAEHLYLSHRGSMVQPDQSWQAAVLGDFAEFRKIGLTHVLMDRIERLLSKTGELPRSASKVASALGTVETAGADPSPPNANLTSPPRGRS